MNLIDAGSGFLCLLAPF